MQRTVQSSAKAFLKPAKRYSFQCPMTSSSLWVNRYARFCHLKPRLPHRCGNVPFCCGDEALEDTVAPQVWGCLLRMHRDTVLHHGYPKGTWMYPHNATTGNYHPITGLIRRIRANPAIAEPAANTAMAATKQPASGTAMIEPEHFARLDAAGALRKSHEDAPVSRKGENYASEAPRPLRATPEPKFGHLSATAELRQPTRRQGRVHPTTRKFGLHLRSPRPDLGAHPAHFTGPPNYGAPRCSTTAAAPSPNWTPSICHPASPAAEPSNRNATIPRGDTMTSATATAEPTPLAQATTHEVGKTYLVLAVRTKWPLTGESKAQTRWVPIMGPPHSDNDVVNFPPMHWHADPRFLDYGELWKDNAVYQIYRYFAQSEFCLERAYINSPIPEVAPDPAVTGREPEHVKIADLKDSRHPPESYYRIMAFTMQRHIVPDQDDQPWLLELTEQFRDKTLVDGRYCPHRRAGAGIEPDAAGVITCPLHGLRWCAKTGQVVDPPPLRTEEEQYHLWFGDDNAEIAAAAPLEV